jgi:glycosyltransferase involved in cell wall biosynthesis
VHVVTLGLNEAQFREARELRHNIFEFIPWLRQQGIVHFLAHPLFDMNGRLNLEVMEKLVLLFTVFEVRNGSRAMRFNEMALRMLVGLTAGQLNLLADKHGIEPYGEQPWIKGMVAGSDDHGSLFIAKAYTEAEADTPQEFLERVGNRLSQPCGEHGGFLTLAHSLYGIQYSFCKEKYDRHGAKEQPFVKAIINKFLVAEPAKPTLMEQARLFYRKILPDALFAHEKMGFDQLLDFEARRLLRDKGLFDELKGNDLNRKIFKVTSHLANRLLFRYSQRLLNRMGSGNLMGVLDSLSTIGLVHIMSLPYYISAYQQHKSKVLLDEVCRSFLSATCCREPANIALFTDTLHEINGVAVTIKRILRTAKERGIDCTVVTCSNQRESLANGVMNFQAIGDFSLPEYAEIKQHFPPVLNVINFLEENGCNRIHISTPGAMGCLGLFLAKLLHLPVTGTYHTDIPQYVNKLTEDEGMERAAWTFITWFYSQMDEITVPSEATKRQLVDNGIDEAKIKMLPRWVNTECYAPAHRDATFYQGTVAGDGLKFLYCGRVSKEKNLQLLAEGFRQVHGINPGARLIVAGDGPFRGEMETLLRGLPVLFLGFVEGEALAKAYASADVFVFPSATDTWGNVVLEAQASGLPVIVTDGGGPKELMVDQKTGLIVAANDRQALTRAMLRFLEHPGLARAMGQAARQYTLTAGPKEEVYATIFHYAAAVGA